MHKTIVTILPIRLAVITHAQYQTNIKQRSSYYLNPVFAGDYPDPSPSSQEHQQHS